MVDFEFTKLPKPLRLINWFIDQVVIIGLLFILTIILKNESKITLNILGVCIFFIYYIICEYFFGRTIGKLTTNTIVVNKADYSNPTLETIFFRTLYRILIVDVAFLYKKTLPHDSWSNTIVVKLDELSDFRSLKDLNNNTNKETQQITKKSTKYKSKLKRKTNPTIALLQKELNVFFSSLIGYIAITIFLVANGLFAWVFPETNILDDGFATLDSFFNFAPWILMFLIPAITMRSFAEERSTGTIEFITTRPVTDTQIVLGKYFAALVLVVFSILPTITYYFTVSALASPVGNVDTGGIIGSYIGLLLLGATFVAIALFTSSVSNNQIVAFISGMFACFFLYLAFDSLSLIPAFVGGADAYFNAISINRHYQNISKGYIDLRDVVYFGSMIGLFILMTRTALGSRKW